MLLDGLLFAGVGSLTAISPLCRRSGTHLNPVVTVAFWTQGKVHPLDLAGYVVSQLLGALVGTAALLGLWRPQAGAVCLGAASPGSGIGGLEAVGGGGRHDAGAGAGADDPFL